MTKREFYAKLAAATKRRKPDWFLGPIMETIRTWTPNSTSPYCHCPLSFVAGVFPCDATAAGVKLGLKKRDAYAIAYAADHPGAPGRKTLLKACGLPV